MSRTFARYPFPDDDGVSLDRVLTRLSADDRLAMTWRPTEDWLLEVSPALSVALAAVLGRVGVRKLEPTMRSGLVLVPERAMRSVQAALAKRPNVSAVWSRVEGVEFATERSRRAFEALI